MKKIKVLLVFVCAVLLFTFLGCKEQGQVDPPVEDVTYEITYNLNGGSFSEEVPTTYKDGSTYKLPKPVKDGWEFVGWYEIFDDGSISEYEVTYLNNRDYKLKATWNKIYQKDVLSDMFTPVKKTYKNIVFKTVMDIELKLDIYLPAMEEGKKYPVLFFFFGGGWYMGDKSYISEYNVILKDLAGEGFVVVSPNYRLVNSKGNPHYPLPVEDCFDAVRYIVKYQDELHIDVNNMGAFGHSAGGYFSLLSAFAQDHFKGDEELKDYEFKMKYAIALSAPCYYDVEAMKNISVIGRGMLAGYFGTSDLTDTSKYASAFPSYYINENNPKIYLVHGTGDELVPLEQSRAFAELAREAGLEVELLEIPYASHTYGSTGGHDVSADYAAGAKLVRDFIISQK